MILVRIIVLFILLILFVYITVLVYVLLLGGAIRRYKLRIRINRLRHRQAARIHIRKMLVHAVVRPCHGVRQDRRDWQWDLLERLVLIENDLLLLLCQQILIVIIHRHSFKLVLDFDTVFNVVRICLNGFIELFFALLLPMTHLLLLLTAHGFLIKLEWQL